MKTSVNKTATRKLTATIATITKFKTVVDAWAVDTTLHLVVNSVKCVSL